MTYPTLNFFELLKNSENILENVIKTAMNKNK